MSDHKLHFCIIVLIIYLFIDLFMNQKIEAKVSDLRQKS